MRTNALARILSTLALSAILPGVAHASMISTNFSLPADVISSGSGSSSSAGYKLISTFSQPATGNGSSASFKAGAGYWNMLSLITGSTPNADTDGDGLTDSQEATLGTNPAVADTDGDGYIDGKEVALGTNPKLASSVPYSLGAAALTRSDGGSSSDNVASGNPKIDLDFTFTVSVMDKSGTPQYVRLLTTQRTAPAAADYFSYPMTCTGSYATGASCSFTTRLGPAFVHKYYIEAKMADGTILTGTPATGPQIQLLNGYTLAGVARDLAGTNLDGATALGSATSYRWVSTGITTDSNKGYYELVDAAKPVKTGEGYFVKRLTGATLPESPSYGGVTSTTYAISLAPGWNLISNPYTGNVLLSAVKVRQGAGAPVSWSTAAANGWVINAAYYFKGSDWGGMYGFASAGGVPDAVLTSWMGYWVYVKKSDATYSLEITKP